jgi:hypothetical protein
VYDTAGINCYQCVGSEDSHCNDPFDKSYYSGKDISSSDGWCWVRDDRQYSKKSTHLNYIVFRNIK